jgi:hypothetical protein
LKSLHLLPKRPQHVAALSAVAAILAVSTASWSVQARDLPVTNQQRSTAQQVAQSGVALSELAPNAPDSHTVKRGDTLWDISKLFLKSPWRWPELWGMNLEQIRNPHLIYPGQVLVLDKVNGRARLRVAGGAGAEGDTVKLSPRVRVGDSLDAVASVNMNLITPFLQEVGVFNSDELATAPRIVATSDERVVIGRGDKAYVIGNTSSDTAGWNVFRSAKPMLDPSTNELLGYEARFLGTAQFERKGTVTKVDGRDTVVPDTYVVTSQRNEMLAGDRLIPTPPSDLSRYAPRAPSKPIGGQIISVYGDNLIAGQNQIVALNRGAVHGLERGHVLAALRDGRNIVDRTNNQPVAVKLPDERAGVMFVFRVFDRVSYALLLQTDAPITRGDRFEQP